MLNLFIAEATANSLTLRWFLGCGLGSTSVIAARLDSSAANLDHQIQYAVRAEFICRRGHCQFFDLTSGSLAVASAMLGSLLPVLTLLRHSGHSNSVRSAC